MEKCNFLSIVISFVRNISLLTYLLLTYLFHKIVLDPLEIPRPKTKTPGDSTLFFLGHLWKFHFVFN